MDADALSSAIAMMSQNMWAVYLCIFAAPFIQEDAAVIAAASLSLGAMVSGPLIFGAVAIGLIASDLWKYWLGRAARSRGWAAGFAQRSSVVRAESAVLQKLGATLMTVRFVPGARIALYIAAGFFEASWPRFAGWIVVSAFCYVAAIFGLFHLIGAVAGEKARLWLPLFAFAALLGYLLYRKVRAKQPAAGAET